MAVTKKEVEALADIVLLHTRPDVARQMVCECGRSPLANHSKPFKETMDRLVIELDARKAATKPAPPPATDARDTMRATMVPTKVVINAEGVTEDPARAGERGITAAVIYVHKEGWSLGAPMRFREEARKQHEGDWAEAWIKLPEGAWQKQWPIGDR